MTSANRQNLICPICGTEFHAHNEPIEEYEPEGIYEFGPVAQFFFYSILGFLGLIAFIYLLIVFN